MTDSASKPEPRRLPRWSPLVGAALVYFNLIMGAAWWLSALGTLACLAYLIQSFRWAAWNVDRQAASMAADQAASDE